MFQAKSLRDILRTTSSANSKVLLFSKTHTNGRCVHTTAVSNNLVRTRRVEHEPKRNQSPGRRAFTSLNQDTPFQLCFLRHGQSTWNRDNRFIGWTDTPLTSDGVLEARVAGQMLYKSGIRFDEVHTSMLRRCIRTANLSLMELGQEYIQVYKHWRLNERNYGALVGQNKKEAVVKFGKDQVKRWRRSFDEPPPSMEDGHPFHPAQDPRYRHILDQIPKSESLKDTLARSSVYWDEILAPALKQNKTLLVVGHENNLRSLIMYLEGISPEDVIELNIPRAVPLAYRLDLETMKPLDRPDGKLDEATGFLRGEWLGGDKAVAEILKRDHQNVYDTSVKTNLETGPEKKKWATWMESVMGKPSPEAEAKGTLTRNDESRGVFTNSPPVPGVEKDHMSLGVPPTPAFGVESVQSFIPPPGDSKSHIKAA